MNVELITKEDLKQFRDEIFEKIQNVLDNKTADEQKWLKSYQVKNLLKISNGTLQNLRKNRTLTFTKIGGIIYYKYEDIIAVLEGRSKRPFDFHPLRK